MLSAIANRYTKAILKTWNTVQELEQVLDKLQKIKIAYNVKKFRELMQSPYLKFNQKQELVFDILGTQDKRMQNFLSFLLKNNRLDIVLYICDLLQSYISYKKKSYEGFIYSKEVLNQEILNKIQNKLASHLGVELKLIQKKIDRDEISLKIQGLGVEISFSKEKFINDLKNHILEAI